MVGVTKSNEEICTKFLDILSDTFSKVVTSLVVSEKIENYDLHALYGLLLNFEETKKHKKLNFKTLSKDPEAALVATSRRNKEIYSRADYYLEQDD